MREQLPVSERIVGARERRREFGGIRDGLEVGHVIITLHLRLVRSVDLVLHLLLPVNTLEPFVLDDVIGTGLEVTVTLGEIGNEDLLDEHAAVLVEVLGEEDLTGENTLVDTHRIFITEGRLTDNHLVGENTWWFLGEEGGV